MGVSALTKRFFTRVCPSPNTSKLVLDVLAHSSSGQQPVLCLQVVGWGNTNSLVPIFGCLVVENGGLVQRTLLLGPCRLVVIDDCNVVVGLAQLLVLVQGQMVVLHSLDILAVGAKNDAKVVENVTSVDRIFFQLQGFRVCAQCCGIVASHLRLHAITVELVGVFLLLRQGHGSDHYVRHDSKGFVNEVVTLVIGSGGLHLHPRPAGRPSTQGHEANGGRQARHT
mmetsp:Transcript_8086/g.18074  ORF Transcript_8086/g.18074 Transcript_8086/m.18074 type:complete len:225 (-) Transcript_8086:122-796(-)